MKFLVSSSNLKGQARIPGSESNTTRAVIIDIPGQIFYAASHKKSVHIMEGARA